jgi:hypothetical protein
MPEEVAIQIPFCAKQPLVTFTPPPNVLVALPVTASALVVAPAKVPFVATRLVVERLVEVALVIVALVPKRLVKVARVALKIEAKKLVEVAAVVVLRRMFVKLFAPVKVFASARSVEDAPVLVVRQTPFTA